MAWSLIRPWEPELRGLPVTTTNTAVPAADGSTLVVMAAIRPGTADTLLNVTVTDNLGGTWSQAPAIGGDAASSSNFYIFARPNAGGVTSVTVSADGAANSAVSLTEWAGGPTSAPQWVAASASRPSGTSWAPVEVTAPAGSLVLGGASMGVTTRFLAVQPPYTLLRDAKGSQIYGVSSYLAPTVETVTGPTFTLTSGTASSMAVVTAALLPGSNEPDPEPPTSPTILRRVNADGSLTPVRLGWAYPDHIDYGDPA